MEIFVKLTDEEIVKILECCSHGCCDDCCPLLKTNDCLEIVRRNALDLIHRLKGSEERLEELYSNAKTEVERLQEALSKAEADVKNYLKVAEYQQNLSVKRYHEIKQLKEDIERLEDINERDVENLRLAKAEVAREIFEEIEKRLDNYHSACLPVGAIEAYTYYEGGLGDAIAELKKKYTEDKT